MSLRLRRTQPELLDQGLGTLADVRANLNDMWRLNRSTGGVSALLTHLLPRLRRARAPIRIADLGTGAARLNVYLAHWARQHGIALECYGLDVSARNLCVAREHVNGHSGVHLLQADGMALPFAPCALDYCISTLLLHHFEPDALIALLRHTFERARCGIIMSDITRAALSQVGFRLIQPLIAPHPMTLHDGIVSIQRAYTPDELRDLARQAGLGQARVYHHPLWRMTLVADKYP
ncbi:MAG: methyltransferase domain-containing protein [Chloroflexota bacterium]|nr:methyltransferase domain-containing protein [Chloroflexota bacterium]